MRAIFNPFGARAIAAAAASIILSCVTPALAGLVDTRVDTTVGGAVVDGTIAADEYGPANSYSYTGGGNGFGGTLGQGVLYMNSDPTNLYFGFQPGNNLNDNAFIMLDTRAGGFVDAQMNDRADGGRRAVSEHTLNADDPYDPTFFPDFGIVIGSFGIVTFELAAGGDGSLIFQDFNGTFTGNAPTPREYVLPLSLFSLNPGDKVDFFMGYTSDGAFNSNESIPAFAPLNSGSNPGFDGPSPGYGDFNRFITVPEPSTLALFAVAGLSLLARRRAVR